MTDAEHAMLSQLLKDYDWENSNSKYRYHEGQGLKHKCASCNTYKTMDQFTRDKTRRNGHRTTCRSCIALKRNPQRNNRQHCDNGHDYWSSGTYYYSEGERKCLECRRDADREWLIANPAAALA